MTAHLDYIKETLERSLAPPVLVEKRGRVVSVSGTIIKAKGLEVKIGELCKLI